ncbi:MAG: antitoxin [Candidatus Sericytochromatia bacterium]|nr:antitoxin [Candidatus Sericytochromatia bacterium]
MAKVAKLFTNGRSQAVRLPAEFRFSGKEVLIERDGDKVVLRPKPDSWGEFFGRPATVPADFLSDRQDPPPEQRDLF